MRKSEAINDIKDIKNYAGKEAECEDTTVSEPVPCYAGPSIMEDMHASALPLDLLRQVCEVSLKEYHEGHCSTHDELDAYIKERMGWKSFPRLGMRDPDLSELDLFSSTEVRRLLVNPNMIFYAEFDGIILILTILNVRQSPETIRKSVAVFLKTYQKRKARQ